MSDDLVGLSANLGLIDEMYEAFRRDPGSVDPTWRALFGTGPVGPPTAARAANGQGGGAVALAKLPGGQRDLAAPEPIVGGDRSTRTRISDATQSLGTGGAVPLVQAFRAFGHLAADLD